MNNNGFYAFICVKWNGITFYFTDNSRSRSRRTDATEAGLVRKNTEKCELEKPNRRKRAGNRKVFHELLIFLPDCYFTIFHATAAQTNKTLNSDLYGNLTREKSFLCHFEVFETPFREMKKRQIEQMIEVDVRDVDKLIK